MPRVSKPLRPLPMSVEAAVKAFGTDLRVALINYFRTNPGSFADAARDLGIPRQVVAVNVKVLMEAEVIVRDEDRRGNIGGLYEVNIVRLTELTTALRFHLLGQ